MSTRCITPFHKKQDESDFYMPLPCGKCPQCLKRRVSGWSFRLMKQGEVSTSALFITLTYDTSHVPITPRGYMTLDKTHVQKFMKRLRKLSNAKLKYYACGEYGGKRFRPHYHMILFNADVEHVVRAWALDNKRIGEVHIGKVSEASIGYTLKYLDKPKIIPMHQNDDRQKEFSLMSKGMGKNYLTENMQLWHKNKLEERMFIPLKDGKKIAMPRYYKDKIYDDVERQKIAIAQRNRITEIEEQERKELGDNYESIKVQRDKQAFEKMYKNSEKRQDL